MKYPSLLQRYLASFIDVAVILLLLLLYAKSPLSKSASGAVATWPLWLFAVYEPICNRYATTLGQLLMGFRVRTFKDHRRVPLWRGFLRLFTKYGLGIISFIRMPVQKHRRLFMTSFLEPLRSVQEVRMTRCRRSPNKSLQRSWTHKVHGRGRPSESAHERWRARVLKCRRAAAELGRWATRRPHL